MARRAEPGIADTVGLRERGHEVELLAARDSALANRVSEAGITVHQAPQFGLRAWAAVQCAVLIPGDDSNLYLNEPHALTAAWLGGRTRGFRCCLRRLDSHFQKNAVSQARYGRGTVHSEQQRCGAKPDRFRHRGGANLDRE